MRISFTRNFNKELQAVRDKRLAEAVQQIIIEIEKAKTPLDIRSIKKLKGHRSAYRVRYGNYRIGLFIQNNEALLAAIGDRKNIYSRFP